MRTIILFLLLCFGGAMATETVPYVEPQPAISCGYDSLMKIIYVQNQALQEELFLARGQMSLMEMQALTTKGELMIEAQKVAKNVSIVAGIAFVFLCGLIVGCR